jgi:DNA-binding NarL/FixJ family response regulator
MPKDGPRARVLVADPFAMTRATVAGWLRTADAGLDVVAAASPQALAEHAARRPPVAAVVLNAGAAGAAEGPAADLLGACRARLPGTPVVLLAADPDQAALPSAAADVRAVLGLDRPPEAIVDALRVVMAGGMVTPSRPAGDRAPAGHPALALRERRVLHAVARGLTNRAIAQELGTTESAVKSLIHRLMRRVGAPNRTALVLAARADGGRRR